MLLPKPTGGDDAQTPVDSRQLNKDLPVTEVADNFTEGLLDPDDGKKSVGEDKDERSQEDQTPEAVPLEKEQDCTVQHFDAKPEEVSWLAQKPPKLVGPPPTNTSMLDNYLYLKGNQS